MDINKSGDQLIVRVWKACNFKCNFCNVSDNEVNVKMKENIDDIVRNFHYKLKYSNLSSKEIIVTISWGEPSIFEKETLFALKYIKSFFEKKKINVIFEIQTNASNIDLNFAKKLKVNWISLALVSFHITDKQLFEKVIQVSYDKYYHKIIEWINNLYNVWIKIDVNIILSNENKYNFLETIKFLNRNFNFIRHFNIWVIQPHWEAYKILDKIIPKYDDISLVYNKAIFYLKKYNRGITSHYVWLPACYLISHWIWLEIGDNKLYRKNLINNKVNLINQINDDNKVQNKECRNCLYNNICSGIWKEYDWLQFLKPIKIRKDFLLDFTKDGICYKIKNKNENLKKIYDWNIRQIILPISIWSIWEIKVLTQNMLDIWFYKISLLIDNNTNISENLLELGIWNIQLDIENLDFKVLELLENFSEKYKPQFSIDIDIFIKSYSNIAIKNLKLLIKLLPKKYINIYFINNYNNKEIYKFKKLIKIINYDNIYTVNFNKKSLYYN